MIPLVTDVTALARSRLGDTDVVGGETFTDAYLAQFFNLAYGRLYDQFVKYSLPRAKNTNYYSLPAYTTRLTPVQAGITDFGELEAGGLSERDAPTSVAISATDTGNPIKVTTTTPHGLASNQEVEIYGVTGQTGANGRWYITVIDATNFTLNGSTSVAAYISGGFVNTGTSKWKEVDQMTDLPDLLISARLRVFEWSGDMFRFIGATLARQLKLVYTTSGNPPASGSIGIDNCLNLLGTLTAGLAGTSKGYPGAPGLLQEALGPNLDGKGGLMWDFFSPMHKAQQNITVARPRYRQRRSIGTGPWF